MSDAPPPPTPGGEGPWPVPTPPSVSGATASPNRRALGLAVAGVLVLIAIGAIVAGTPGNGGPTFPPVGATTGPAGNVAAATRGDVIRALATQGLQAEDATVPYRPAEAAGFAAAPRVVLRAILADDPDHGQIVIYEFDSPAAALAAADEQAAYVASGVGRVQFPVDARFVIRAVGSTAVFFSWSPAASPESRADGIAAALRTLGLDVPIPG